MRKKIYIVKGNTRDFKDGDDIFLVTTNHQKAKDRAEKLIFKYNPEFKNLLENFQQSHTQDEFLDNFQNSMWISSVAVQSYFLQD